MPQRPAYVPRQLLVDPDTWKAADPAWRSDADPAAVAAARVQHRLARLLRSEIRARGIDRDTAAAEMGLSRSQLYRQLDGLAPIGLVQACGWARQLGVRLDITEAGPTT